jgi:hypothetical protein
LIGYNNSTNKKKIRGIAHGVALFFHATPLKDYTTLLFLQARVAKAFFRTIPKSLIFVTL